MMQKSLTLTLAMLTLVALIHPRALPAREPSEGSKLSLLLHRSGSDDDITGKADFRSQNGKSRFRLRIQRGPSEHELEIRVGGVSRGTITTSRSGSASVVFAAPVTGKTRLLDFDPRSREIEIHDLNDDKLLTSTGANRTVDERANLVSTGVQPDARGHARLRERKGRREFTIEIEDVTEGAYDLLVDGVPRGTMNAVAGRGELEFGDDSSGLPLDFDPLGKLIQVLQNGSVILTGNLLAGAPGVSVCTPAETTIVLTNLGLDLDASGDARLRIGDDCRRDFRVQVENLPVGDYDLVVAGVGRGTIAVTNGVGATGGEVEFSSDPSEAGKLPLDFDPAGQVIEIKQGASVFLSGTVGAPTTGACTVMDTELDMTNTGADADAKGKSRLRQAAGCERNFRVEIEKLPVGGYELVVGGVVRGTVTVALVLGEPVGHIEFDTDPDQPGEILLTFDPRGQLVEIRQDATVFLNVTMPE